MQADNEDDFLDQVSNLLVEVGGYALVHLVLGAEEDGPEMIACTWPAPLTTCTRKPSPIWDREPLARTGSVRVSYQGHPSGQ